MTITGRQLYDLLPASSRPSNQHLLRHDPNAASAQSRQKPGKGPNKNEARYALHRLRGLDARYEPLTFRMRNGHRFTPDWVIFVGGLPSVCIEVKGNYKLHSQRSARLAFDQCRAEFPGLKWIWAKWNGKEYADETYTPAENIKLGETQAGA